MIRPICSPSGAEPTSQLVVRRGHAELAEEHRRQLVVVVLARVHEHLLVALAQTRDTAAAFTNCGRFPTSVSTRIPLGWPTQRAGGEVREFAEETVKTGIKAARHIFRYLSYHMSR